MNAEIAKLLNEQVNREFFSAYLYLDIANHYIENNLEGFGNWFKVQAQEERDHAALMITYLQDNSQKVTLEAIKAPNATTASLEAPIAEALAHEKYITKSIHDIYAASVEQKDFRTMQFLDWFVKEQGEEEKNADTLLQRFKLFGNDPRGLYMLDAELATRTYAPPTLTL